jgi:hypothetical protein
MIKELQTLIGNDIKEKMYKKAVSKYEMHRKMSVCSEPTLTRILEGESGKTINLDLLFKIYKALGEKEINISGEGVRLLVKIGY